MGTPLGSGQLVVVLGRSFEEQAARLPDATALAGFRLGAAQMIKSLSNTEVALAKMPPTYANYLAVYRGLAGVDAALLDAAEAYRVAGLEIHQGLAAAQEAGVPPAGARADAGTTLLAVGRQLAAVLRAVHRLGVALEME